MMTTTTNTNSSPHRGLRYPPEIRDAYDIRDTLGTGGFAKVKIAKHKITGEKVAIKIMSKQQLKKTNDLHRAYLEIEALRKLKHQNISRLYQVVETADAFYLVMEYASGGELFDYIILREKLRESEARKFFRQIASAVDYCHKKGFIHRDLKPENLLLDDNKNIKLIDFGLIGQPKDVNTTLLKTCCGSAAYAAPELIRGEKYIGPPADVWSLGILLYALLCGFLPFDDDNTQKLYRQIQKGMYEIPPWLSFESQKFIGSMLRHKPEQRISMDKLLKHPWMLKGLPETTTAINPESTLDPMGTLYPNIVQDIARYYACPVRFIEDWLREWNYDEVTAIHELYQHRLMNNDPIKLAPGKGKLPKARREALIKFKTTKTAIEKSSSPLANAMTAIPSKSQQQMPSSSLAKTGKAASSEGLSHRSSSSGMSNSPSSSVETDAQVGELANTLFNTELSSPNTSPSLAGILGPDRKSGRVRSGSYSESPTPVTGKEPSEVSPSRSRGSSPHKLRNRSNTLAQGEVPHIADLFKDSRSLQAQADQMNAGFGSLQNVSGPSHVDNLRKAPSYGSNPAINTSTDQQHNPSDNPQTSTSNTSSASSRDRPRRPSVFNAFTKSLMNVFGGSSKSLTEPRVVQGAFTTNSTSSRPADEIYADLLQVLKDKGCDIKEPRKYQVRAKFFDTSKQALVTIHFEVCYVARMEGIVGINPKRIKGDTWEYQQKVREVLGNLRL